MPYKLQGTTSDQTKLLILDESDYNTIEQQTTISGNWEVDSLSSNTKTVIGRNINTGETLGYGAVSPIYYAGIPDNPYAYYTPDSIVSSSLWENTTGDGPDLNHTLYTVSVSNFGGYDCISCGSYAALYGIFSSTLPAPMTFAAVYYQSSWDGPFFGLGSASANNYSHRLEINRGANQVSWYYNTNTLSQISGSSIFYGQWQLLTMRWNNVSNWYNGSYSGHVRINGVDEMFTTYTSYTARSNCNLRLGSAPLTNCGNNKWVEVLYWDRVVTDEELNMLEGVLMEKYSL